jgi:carbon monoxide dehydrogenase subunit G
MKIDERFSIAAPIDKVWAFIRDPQTVAPCVPGCESVETLSETSYRSTIRIALGPIKARFNVIVQITEETPPARLVCVTKGEEGSKASIISATSEMLLTAIDDKSTEIACRSEVSIVGRLGKFGLGIMKKRAGQLAGEFATAVQQRMQTVDV